MSVSNLTNQNGLISTIVQNSSLATMFANDEGWVSAFNQALVDLLGYSNPECEGCNIFTFIHPDEVDFTVKRWQEFVGSGEPSLEMDRRYIHKTGRDLWISATASRVADENGHLGFLFQLLGQDSQIYAGTALADSELRWTTAVEGVQQGLWDHNHVTGVSYLSKSWRRMRGLGPNEQPASTQAEWLSAIHPDDLDQVLEYQEKLYRGAINNISYEFRERHEDGHWMWILSRGKPVQRDANGRPTRIIGTDTDVTKIKEADIRSRQVSHRLELALSTSKIGVWDYDFASDKLVWDARTCELFGMAPVVTQISHGTWEKALHPADRQRVSAIAANAMRNQQGYEFDYRVVLPTGAVRYLRSRASFYDEPPSGPKMVGVNWDVTGDIERQEELQWAKNLADKRNNELEVARARMEFISYHDPLTELPNRRHLDKVLKEFDAAKSKRGGRVALMHIDLDRFKQINDTIGHAAGDAILVKMAEILSTCVGDIGIVARVGGDEFVVWIEDAPSDEKLLELADCVIGRASAPVQFATHEIRFGASVGVATKVGRNINSAQLLINADIALYGAKNDGRGRCLFFNDEMQRAVILNKSCADDILAGLESNDFEVFYQPLFTADDHELASAEALVRWRHPQQGILTPDQFLKVAEEFGSVAQIDHLVMQQALADMKGWQAAGLNVPGVSVNVSARRLQDRDLVAKLAELNIEAGTLSFELLESIFLDEHDDVVQWNIDGIRELGIAIDVDDFGTGHASIMALQNLNPRRLKIDRQLIKPIVHSDKQRHLVRSIVEIGKSQDIQVVAEGVETMEHATIAKELGCDLLQGFEFARPMARDEFEKFVQTQAWRDNSPAHKPERQNG